MNQVIIFKFNGSLCILYPSGILSVQETAIKDVPAGIPFKIINKSLLPQDRTFRNAWDIVITIPDGIGQGYNWLEN